MQRKPKTGDGGDGRTRSGAASEELTPNHAVDTPEFRVEDRRHWNSAEVGAAGEAAEVEPRKPSLIDEYRQRAAAAEARLQEYIEAFKQHQSEQDEFRARLTRDVDRRVELRFAELVRDLLEPLDALELGLVHASAVPEAEPLASGVALARDRLFAILGRHGIERIEPTGRPFDPSEAEAVRVDPVDSDERDGQVTETLRTGFRLGQHVIRPARVAVGRR